MAASCAKQVAQERRKRDEKNAFIVGRNRFSADKDRHFL
jgi:hypothetical protein